MCEQLVSKVSSPSIQMEGRDESWLFSNLSRQSEWILALAINARDEFYFYFFKFWRKIWWIWLIFSLEKWHTVHVSTSLSFNYCLHSTTINNTIFVSWDATVILRCVNNLLVIRIWEKTMPSTKLYFHVYLRIYVFHFHNIL